MVTLFFLQSCVDSCHSSAALLDHFCFLWRPFPIIMQIMNNTPDGWRSLDWWRVKYHGMMPAVLSTWACRGRKDRCFEEDTSTVVFSKSDFALLCWHELVLQHWDQRVQYVDCCLRCGVGSCCGQWFLMSPWLCMNLKSSCTYYAFWPIKLSLCFVRAGNELGV